MKKFLWKSLAIIILILGMMSAVNYIVDPSNIFDSEMTSSIAEHLLAGETVEVTGNYEERLVQQEWAKHTTQAPETLLMGSSHMVYMPMGDRPTVRNVGISACELWDIYGILGMYEYYDVMPKRIVLGVDPWFFNDNSGGTRYEEINGFVEYEKNNVLGKKTIGDAELNNRIANLKELVSIPYFQTSFRELRTNGIPGDNLMSVVENLEPGDGMKITSDGTHIPANAAYNEMEQLKKNIQILTHGGSIYHVDNFEEVSPERTLWFERLLTYLQDRGVEVILYMPICYPQEIYDYVAATPGYDNVVRVEEYLLNYAGENDIALYGSYDPSMFGCELTDYIDELHLKPEKVVDTWVRRE